MHKNSVLWVYNDGCLKIPKKGVMGNPVTIQGDRLEQVSQLLARSMGQEYGYWQEARTMK